MKMPKVGAVIIHRTHINANASKYKHICYNRIAKFTTWLNEDNDTFISEAEAGDKADGVDDWQSHMPSVIGGTL